MGLSHEERISKIYEGITRLTEVLHGLDDAPQDSFDTPDDTNKRLARLRTRAGDLWHCLLGHRSNSTFWLLGGDLTNPVKNALGGPWSAAIASLCDEHREDPGRVTMSQLREEASERARAEGRKLPEEPFDPFDDFLSVRGLVSHAPSGVARVAVYDVYGWAEAIAYALRRYNDDLLKGLDDLSRCIADIQGICHTIFAADEVYGRAYVLNRVLEHIYGARYGKDTDPVRRIFRDLCIHHDLSRPMVDSSLKECIGWDRELLTAKKAGAAFAPAGLRLVLALRVAGRRFHYDHQFAALLTAARKNLTVGEFAEYEPKLHQTFAACQRSHKEQEDADMDRHRRNAADDAARGVHGTSLPNLGRDPGAPAPAMPKRKRPRPRRGTRAES